MTYKLILEYALINDIFIAQYKLEWYEFISIYKILQVT